MQFSATWQDVLAGKKTMTRRTVSERHAALIAPDTAPCSPHTLPDQTPVYGVLASGRLRYAVGRSLAIQPGRGKHAIGRIQITAIRYCARAGDISEEDARAEGFETAAEFCAVYGRLNGAGALERACWALTFVRMNCNDQNVHCSSRMS